MAAPLPRPWALASAAIIVFASGFVAASVPYPNTPMCLWAEGESVRVTAASATHDPDIWPPLEHSFSEEVDLLSPQPLFTPISSLGPATADSAALLAAHMWATERLAVAVEPEPVHSPRVATVDSQTERPSPREPQKNWCQ